MYKIPSLSFGEVGGVAIAQVAYGKTFFSFQITLVPEFYE